VWLYVFFILFGYKIKCLLIIILSFRKLAEKCEIASPARAAVICIGVYKYYDLWVMFITS